MVPARLAGFAPLAISLGVVTLVACSDRGSSSSSAASAAAPSSQELVRVSEKWPPRAATKPPPSTPQQPSAEPIGLPRPASADLPTGTYRLEVTRLRDGCSPKQSREGVSEQVVVSRVLPSGTAVSFPLGVADTTLAPRRIEVPLRTGETTLNLLKVHPPAGIASVSLRTTVKEVRADGFTVVVLQSWEGLEREPPGPATATPIPSRSCLAEHELRFTLIKELCPSRCSMDARVLGDGGVVGDCACTPPHDGG